MTVRTRAVPRSKKRPPAASSPGETLGIKARDFVELDRVLQEGLRYAVLSRLEKRIDLTQQEIGTVLRIPARTLARRKVQRKFTPLESERLYRLAEVVESAIELFEGDVRLARNWLRSPCKALAGKTPLEMSETEFGAHEVRNLIGRLEHGVFT
jgi:putative toxin-antitoxin system antitoxin component (TIGR02293 family)